MGAIKLMQEHDILDDNCTDRIKPTLLRDVKTEALLVLSRTVLERFFKKFEDDEYLKDKISDDYKEHIYMPLQKLKKSLQKHVVNADYLINLMHLSKKYPQLQTIVTFEDPLMQYYNAMAHRVSVNYDTKELLIPEFLVISLLSHWVLEEEKSTALYPFLNDIDYMSLIERFELNREYFKKDGEDILLEVQDTALKVIDKLKKTKFKSNKNNRTKSKRKK